MLVAGVDIGNSTTELAAARVAPGRAPEFLLVLRRATTGAKGSRACAEGVAELVTRAERQLGERPHELLLAELSPVETGLIELGRIEELELGRTAIARPASATPSGLGVGVGELRRLDQLAGEPGRPAVAVVVDEDFEDAARALVSARERGWRIAAVVVRGDDGVLIGNRFDRRLPIVDEVDDAAQLPLGAEAAVEVAPAGGEVEALADPLRLAVLLELAPAEARAARRAAVAVAGRRAAIVVRQPAQQAAAVSSEQVVLVRADGARAELDERAAVPAPGEITGLRGVAGDRDGLLDVFWTRLPVPHDDTAFSQRLARRRPVGLALLAPGRPDGLLEELASLCAGGARVVARESDAAVLGASTTPGAGRTPLVVDLGGGTVDLHHGSGAVVAAGAGELVTRLCAATLGCPPSLAERAKLARSARPETPFLLHHEDGTRTVVSDPVPGDAVGRLCVVESRGLSPLDADLAPEVWRGLRRAAKRDVLAVNVGRALAAAGGAPPGELVTLVGGCASDPECVREVAAVLGELDLAVARADVLGRHGPRAAVAVGLVLAAGGQAGARR